MAFDVAGARQAGYTDAEIADFMGQAARYDVKGARSSGYPDSEIIAHLSAKVPSAVPLPPAVAPGTPIPAATRAIVPDTPTTFGEKVVGALETGATALTSATTGMIGGAGGLAGGMTAALLDGSFGTPEAEKLITEHMKQGAQAMTYTPKTLSGQQQTEALGEIAQQAAPLTGLAAPLAQIGNAARATVQAPRVAAVTAATRAAESVPAPVVDAARSVSTGAQQATAAVTGPISSVTGKVRAALAPSAERRPTPGTGGSAGAAGTDLATMRRANAQDLPQPIDLTEGQATRSMEQQRFERETAKNPQLGAPLRERFEKQNEQLLQNFDAFVDQTGAQAPNLRAVGTAVDSALTKQYQADKAKVRTAYKAAEAAGELEAPVTLDNLVKHLNDSAPDAATAPVLDVARKRALQLGIAAEDADGNLVAQPVQLKTAETMRQAINRATDYEPTNVRQSTLMKLSIDEATDGLGGKLYKQARSERRRMAENYENRSVINKLLNNKRGTDDRQVALEDVFSHSILDGSLDDVRNVRRVLQRGGEEGQQAWRELQGQTLNHIRDEMTKNVARDGKGNPVVSAAALDKVIKKLDADGKLDYVFGKRGGQQLRVLNDVAKDVLVATPGAVNTSNTASVILAALDMGMSGAAGLPLPVASGLRMLANNIKDKKLAARVRESLGPASKEPSKF